MSLAIKLYGQADVSNAVVIAYLGDRRAGAVRADHMLRHAVMDVCLEYIEVLEEDLGRRLDSVWKVGYAMVENDLRGWGLGVELYAALIELVGHHIPGAVVVADACSQGGSSSSAALRVWNARELADRVIVAGLAATTETSPAHWTSSHPGIERAFELDAPRHALKASLMPPG